MKTKFFIIIGLTLITLSCGSKKSAVTSVDKSVTEKIVEGVNVSYKSLGNDQASISLQLLKNNTFKFNMKILASEDDEDSKTSTIDEKGTYTSDGNWKTLKFKNPKISLATIFDKKYGTSDAFEVIDEKTVKINVAQKALPIWGVLCEKE